MEQVKEKPIEKLPEDTRAYFIKLGRGGVWEQSCIENGTIQFGYHDTPQEFCTNGDWDEVHKFWTEARGNAGTAKNDTRQIQTFFEADEHAIFITFWNRYLWWCHPSGVPKVLTDEGNARLRQTLDGWKKTSLGGDPLLISRLSGKLTKTQMYKGTICEVAETPYLLRRINDEKTPELAAVETTEAMLIDQVLAMIRLLDPKDFELLVELIFSTSGWRRQTRTGGSQKTVDLDLLLPSTGERAFVQVKSQTSTKQFDGYAETFASTDAHARMFFVWHTGAINREPTNNVTLWGPDVVAAKAIDAGLLAWLKDRIA